MAQSFLLHLPYIVPHTSSQIAGKPFFDLTYGNHVNYRNPKI